MSYIKSYDNVCEFGPRSPKQNFCIAGGRLLRSWKRFLTPTNSGNKYKLLYLLFIQIFNYNKATTMKSTDNWWLTAFESTSLWIATVLIPKRLHVSITRHAISPRFATKIFLNCCQCTNVTTNYIPKAQKHSLNTDKNINNFHRSCTN